MHDKLSQPSNGGRLLKWDPTRYVRSSSVKETLCSQEIRSYVRVNLERVFERLGLPLDNVRQLAKLIMQAGRRSATDEEFFAQSSRLFSSSLDFQASMHVERVDANELLSGPLKKARGPICCFGMGVVSELARKVGREVFFVDGKSASSTSTNFAVVALGESKVKIPTNFSATTIFFNSLHRLSNPTSALEEARRITQPGGQILVIEPVVGILRDEAGVFGAEFYASLSTADQYAVAVFFEKVYSKVIGLPRAFETKEGEKHAYHFRQMSEHRRLLIDHGIEVDCAELIGSAFSSGPLVWGRIYGRVF